MVNLSYGLVYLIVCACISFGFLAGVLSAHMFWKNEFYRKEMLPNPQPEALSPEIQRQSIAAVERLAASLVAERKERERLARLNAAFRDKLANYWGRETVAKFESRVDLPLKRG